MNEKEYAMKKEITFEQIIKKTIALTLSVLLLLLFMVFNITKIEMIDRKFIIIAIILSAILILFTVVIKYRQLLSVNKRIYYHLIDFMFTINLVFLFAQIFFALVFFPATVYKSSMYPTLNENDHIIVYTLPKPKRFDIIVLRVDAEYNTLSNNLENNELIVKRLIGLPGDNLYYKDGYLYLDGESVVEPYLLDEEGHFLNNGNAYTNDFSLANLEIKGESFCDPDSDCKIPEDYYLVLGDNRQSSIDSRTIGLFHRSQIIGVVKHRVNNIFKWEKL